MALGTFIGLDAAPGPRSLLPNEHVRFGCVCHTHVFRPLLVRVGAGGVWGTPRWRERFAHMMSALRSSMPDTAAKEVKMTGRSGDEQTVTRLSGAGLGLRTSLPPYVVPAQVGIVFLGSAHPRPITLRASRHSRLDPSQPLSPHRKRVHIGAMYPHVHPQSQEGSAVVNHRPQLAVSPRSRHDHMIERPVGISARFDRISTRSTDSILSRT